MQKNSKIINSITIFATFFNFFKIIMVANRFVYAAFWDHPSPLAYNKDLGFLLFNKLRYDPPTERIEKSLEENVFVITGASSGIGLETVHILENMYANNFGTANSHGRVVSAVRNMTKWKDVHKHDIETVGIGHGMKVDLSSLQSVKDFAVALEDYMKSGKNFGKKLQAGMYKDLFFGQIT